MEVSSLVKDTARGILRLLRNHPDGLSKEKLIDQLGVSGPSIQRALTWLRDHCDSPLEYVRARSRWVLQDPNFSLPLSDPDHDDLAAVFFAEALLAPIAEPELRVRIRRLAEQMDAEIRDRGREIPHLSRGAVTATVTTEGRVDPAILTTLLHTIAHHVVRIDYASPWSELEQARIYDVEPWQLRVHDGVMYLRAWSHYHAGARSFRVAQIDHIEVRKDRSPIQKIPPAAQIWGEDDPAFGIDHDRPDIAVLKIRGPVARWVHRMQWDPRQEDRWTEQGQCLERRVPYRSCREFARRLLSLGEGLESIEPDALRDEVRRHLRSMHEKLLP